MPGQWAGKRGRKNPPQLGGSVNIEIGRSEVVGGNNRMWGKMLPGEIANQASC